MPFDRSHVENQINYTSFGGATNECSWTRDGITKNCGWSLNNVTNVCSLLVRANFSSFNLHRNTAPSFVGSIYLRSDRQIEMIDGQLNYFLKFEDESYVVRTTQRRSLNKKLSKFIVHSRIHSLSELGKNHFLNSQLWSLRDARIAAARNYVQIRRSPIAGSKLTKQIERNK